jgi:hypothetical protein
MASHTTDVGTVTHLLHIVLVPGAPTSTSTCVIHSIVGHKEKDEIEEAKWRKKKKHKYVIPPFAQS